MDKSFLEQRIRIVDANYILCEKNWTHTRAELGVMAGRQAGGSQNTGEFGIFYESLYIKRFDFLLRLTKVQHHYSSRNAFQVFFG